MNDLGQFWALILDPRNLIVVGLLAMKWRLATTHECPEDGVAWLSRAMRLVRHHSSAIVTLTSLVLCPFAHAGEPFWRAFLYGWIYSALAIHAYSLGPKRWFKIEDGKGPGAAGQVALMTFVALITPCVLLLSGCATHREAVIGKAKSGYRDIGTTVIREESVTLAPDGTATTNIMTKTIYNSPALDAIKSLGGVAGKLR